MFFSRLSRLSADREGGEMCAGHVGLVFWAGLGGFVAVLVCQWPYVSGHVSVVRTWSRASGPAGRLGSVA